MSTLGTGITQSVAGLNQAQRVVAQGKDKADNSKTSARRVRADRPDELVVGLETAEAVRSLKDNTHGEAREDHEQHPLGDQSNKKPRVPHGSSNSESDQAIEPSTNVESLPSQGPQQAIKHIDLEG